MFLFLGDIMKIKKFFKTVDDIVLHQGSLDELNRQEEINGSGRTYDLMPMKSGVRYLTGIIIPKPEEVKEILAVNFSRIEPNTSDEEADEAAEYVFELAKETLYEVPRAQKFDLRMVAKEFGANGLIRLQLDTESKLELKDSKYSSLNLTTYQGTPVRLI